jgi:hypothetical protein
VSAGKFDGGILDVIKRIEGDLRSLQERAKLIGFKLVDDGDFVQSKPFFFFLSDLTQNLLKQFRLIKFSQKNKNFLLLPDFWDLIDFDRRN